MRPEDYKIENTNLYCRCREKDNVKSYETYMVNPRYDLTGIAGYGMTKEESLKNFIKKFKCAKEELDAFEKILLSANEISVIDVEIY